MESKIHRESKEGENRDGGESWQKLFVKYSIGMILLNLMNLKCTIHLLFLTFYIIVLNIFCGSDLYILPQEIPIHEYCGRIKSTIINKF